MSSSRSSLTHPTSSVAFGVARALTSYVRRLYERRYRGRMPHPRRVFLFDAVLLLIVAGLLGTLYWITTWPVPQPGIRIHLSTPPVVSAAPIPFTLTVQSMDGQTHQSVRIRWHLPAEAEVLAADPPIDLDGWSFVGVVSPEFPVTVRAVIRPLIAEGDKAVFGLTVTSDSSEQHTFFGEGIRMVERSALTATVPDVFQVAQVARAGALVPIRVANESRLPLPLVFLRLKERASSSEERLMDLGTLAPAEVRWVYVPVPPPEEGQETAAIAWTVGAASRDVSVGSWQAAYVPPSVSFPQVVGSFVARSGNATRIALSDVTQAAEMVLLHPFLPEPAVRLLPASDGSLTIPAVSAGVSPTHKWIVAPIVQGALGPASVGTVQTDLPFSTQVRYTASTGDRLGAGPLPPKVDVETRYWVFWTVGPLDSDVEGVTVRTTLPPGVSATGNVSAPDGGTSTAVDRTVSWSLPRLGSEQTRATFGFEIGVTPTAGDVGSALLLLGTSAASARDTDTQLSFTAETGPFFSTLAEFETVKGIVMP